MKVLSLVTVFFLVFFAGAYGQKEKRVLISAAFGASLPVGKYGSKAATDHDAGLAQTGITARVSGTYLFKAAFGAALVARFGENKLSEAGLRESLLQSGGGYANIGTKTGHWTVAAAMAGPVWRVPLSHSGRTVFMAQATAGGCKTYVPFYRYSALIIGNPPNGVTGSVAYSSGRQPMKLAFCYEVRPELAFRLSRSVCLTASASYFGTTSYKYVPIHSGSIVLVGTLPGEEPNVYITYAHTPVSWLAGEVGIEIGL